MVQRRANSATAVIASFVCFFVLSSESNQKGLLEKGGEEKKVQTP
jgi:hypothetical protein